MQNASQDKTAVGCRLCHSYNTIKIVSITDKPLKETNFLIKKYKRTIYKCSHCGVYCNIHNYNLTKIYTGGYNKVTYNNKILEKYQQIMNLPIEQSDNKQRVKRIVEFCRHHSISSNGRILDIGSGLCVFLGELKKYGFYTYCVDPDPLSVGHAFNNVGVTGAFQSTIESFEPKKHGLVKMFDIVTLNKVLEHVINPIDTLIRASRFINDSGIIYIELPDSLGAEIKNDFINREEFFIDHYFIFNERSVKYLVINAVLKPLEIKRIKEPSGKYTIYAFLQVHIGNKTKVG